MLGGGELGDGLRCEGAGMGAEQLGQREWEDIVWPSTPEQDGSRLPSWWPLLCMRPLCATNILPGGSSLKHDQDDDKDDKDEDDRDLWWLLGLPVGHGPVVEAGEVGPRPDAKATVEAPVVYGGNKEEDADNGEEAEFRGVARV